MHVAASVDYVLTWIYMTETHLGGWQSRWCCRFFLPVLCVFYLPPFASQDYLQGEMPARKYVNTLKSSPKT